MSSTAISSSLTTASAPKQLSKAANGEYTAASVAADPTDTQKLGLVKQKDGNYAAKSADLAVSNGGSAASTSSSAVLDALTSLTKGG